MMRSTVEDDALFAVQEIYGLRNARLTLLQQLVNTTFRVDSEQGRFLLRLHCKSGQTESRIQSELRWLTALGDATSLKLQRPFFSMDGRSVVSVRGMSMSMLSWLEGNVLPQAERTLEHYRALGHVTAGMHQHAQEWTAENLDRPRLGAEALIAAEGWQGLAPDAASLLQELCHRLRNVEQHLGTDRNVFGLIHGDLSFGNVLFAGNKALPIDFDDCGFGHYVYDLAVILAGTWSRPDFAQCRTALLTGYREARPLAEEALKLLPVFMAARAATLVLWESGQTSADAERYAAQLERVRIWLRMV